MTFDEFQLIFRKARSIFRAVEEEILSRELPMATQLSFSIVADELDIAELLLTQGQGVEAMIRASGVIARVALERHLRTVVASRSLVIPTNRPNQLPVADILSTLVKANVITPVQRSQFDSLFSVANNCAHPNGPVVLEDVKRLLRQGRELAAVVL